MIVRPNTLDLSHVPLLADVPEPLRACVTPDMRHYYVDGDALIRQGDTAKQLVVLLRGQVRVVADDIFLVSRGPYDVIGEQAFIENDVHSATVLAQGMVDALVIPRPVVEALMADSTFSRNLLRLISYKLREATDERAYRYRNEKLLFSEFRAHLSPEVTQRLLATGTSYGDPRYIDAVILFSDIRSFTDRSAGMTPTEIAAQLSPYLDAAVTTIHRHEGMVDKFIGDAVMAVWGLAPSTADLPSQAFACAQEMVRVAANMHFGGQPIAIGVGLNAGEVFIGNVGGEGKRQFTVLGSPVNLAARYESETKGLGAPIVVGQGFYDRLPADVKGLFTAHENRPVKGAEAQTLYTFDPTLGMEKGSEE